MGITKEEQHSDDEMNDYGELHAAQNRKGKKAGGWQNLGLDHNVYKAIEKMGYKKPTPIQTKAIPLILDNKDVVAMSRTGSGKTAAFVVPMLQKLKARNNTGIRALLLSPTRELATQTFFVVKQLGKFTGLRAACLVGGDSMDEQFTAIHGNPDILIATPGRLLHLAVEMDLKLNTVRYVVFDEADRLFEMGFAEQLLDILKRLPDSRQTLLFSATLPKVLINFAKAGLSDPTLIRLDVDTKISEKLSMAFIACRPNSKISALLFLARRCVDRQEQTIIFCATMKHVEYVAAIFREAGLDCCFLYSQLDAAARKINIGNFRNKKCYLLVVTDVAARGVDIPLLDNAINFHFPSKPKLFVHRVGRVARAGKSGTAYSLVSQDEMPYVMDFFLFLGRPLKIAEENSEYDPKEALIGGFPDDLVHMETDFLKSIHELSLEVSDLKHKSENAMKKYKVTRSAPSMQSVRRSKKEFKEMIFPPHPILEVHKIAMKADFNVLEGIRNYKPAVTIFEFNANSKNLPADVMKNKRKVHAKYIQNADKEIKTPGEELAEKLRSDDEESEMSDEENVETFQNVVKVTKFSDKPAEPVIKKKKGKYDLQKERDKAMHYVSYRAADEDTERGLQIDNNTFDKMAKDASVEIIADDDKGINKNKSVKKWDRVKKKYVGETSIKRIRTEEGTLVPASYSSGRYQKWQQNNKTKYRHDDDDDAGPQSDKLGNRRKKVWHSKGSKKALKDEVKDPQQIFKQRRKKQKVQEFQESRRQENLKRKIGQLKKRGTRSSNSKPNVGGGRSKKGGGRHKK
uniref:RNA helicase n=1 Tax=Panagrolaimus sp. JU765 TaxID=591449 RepID=A0AC34QK98_9BILA